MMNVDKNKSHNNTQLSQNVLGKYFFSLYGLSGLSGGFQVVVGVSW